MTSEQVHWLYGALLAAFSVPMLLHARGIVRARWPEYVIGAGLLLFGLGLIFDPFLHGAARPGDYAAETAQHLTLGIVLLLGSGFELFRAVRRRETLPWRVPLVVALLVASLTFLVHAQHEADVPMLLLVTQHRFIAATLLVLAAAVLLAPRGDARARGIALPLLVLLLGLELLAYSEGNSLFGVPAQSHQAAGRMSH